MTKITGFDTFDVRFPTSRTLAGSDAMNPAPDYSAAYLVIRTDAADPALAGHGFAFTIGRGNMVGAATGVILLGVVQNILDLENAPNYWIDAIDGAVILVALILARVIGGEASAE